MPQSISFRVFHLSCGALMCSALWMVLLSHEVQMARLSMLSSLAYSPSLLAYSLPTEDRSQSPPIMPLTLYSLSPGEVDRSSRNVNVHQVVNYPRLYVAFVFVNHHLLPRVENLDKTELLPHFVQRLVLTLVVFYPQFEVSHNIFLFLAHVVWICCFTLPDV